MKKHILVLIIMIFWASQTTWAQITVFRDANWSGPSLVIYDDWNFTANPDWNDQISSIRIPQGHRIQVFVDDSFNGASRILTGDWTVNGNDFNDVISSIKFLHHHDRQPYNAAAPAPPAATNRLCCGQELPLGGELHALNDRYMLAFQRDRNLVLYKRFPGISPLWATATNNRVNRCVMQADGNLVLYNDNNPIWSSNTYGNESAYLVMQDDGNLVIYSTDGRPLWASNTNQPDEPAPVMVTVQAPQPPPPPPVAPVVTGPCSMDQSAYDAAVSAIDGQAFKDTKMQVARQAIKHKCLSVEQIRGIAKLFAFEDQVLDFLKYAYDFTDDKDNYYTLSNVFSFDSNVTDFNTFLGTK